MGAAEEGWRDLSAPPAPPGTGTPVCTHVHERTHTRADVYTACSAHSTLSRPGDFSGMVDTVHKDF